MIYGSVLSCQLPRECTLNCKIFLYICTIHFQSTIHFSHLYMIRPHKLTSTIFIFISHPSSSITQKKCIWLAAINMSVDFRFLLMCHDKTIVYFIETFSKHFFDLSRILLWGFFFNTLYILFICFVYNFLINFKILIFNM